MYIYLLLYNLMYQLHSLHVVIMATLNKSIVAYFVALLVIFIIAYYATGGFKAPLPNQSTTTTVQGGSTTVKAGNTTSLSTTSQIFLSQCNTFTAFYQANNGSYVGQCSWTGGALGLWVASGNSGSESVKITGSNGNVYVNQTGKYQCLTFFQNFTAPSGTYTITLHTGAAAKNQSLNCTKSEVVLNTTLTPPQTVYDNVYNGNFSNGKYTGWTLQGAGFGAYPINITQANNPRPANTAGNANIIAGNRTGGCYPGTTWANNNFTFFASTYNCGTSVAPGNITSSLFWANKAFLNFRIISPQDASLYVEILYNDTPYVIAHYNTYNTTSGESCRIPSPIFNSTGNTTSACAASYFRNATIPLVTVSGKAVRVRVVAGTLVSSDAISVSAFNIASRPHQDSGILYGSYNFTH